MDETNTTMIDTSTSQLSVQDRLAVAVELMDEARPTLPDLLAARDLIDRLKEFTRAAEATWDANAFVQVQASGPFMLGSRRWFIAEPTQVKCASVPKTLHALLEATNGDEEATTDCFSVNAFKPGAVRKAFAKAGCPQRFDELFVTSFPKRLASEQVKELASVDTKFIK